MFLKKELLVEKAKQLEKSLRPKKGLTIENYRQELEKALSGNAHTGNDSEDEDVPEDSHELHVATEIMSAAFLNSQKRGNQEGESKCTIRGQCAEEPLLRQFFESDFGKRENFVAMYRTGLIVREDSSHICDSPDAVVILEEDDGEKVAMPVEVKGRVSDNTFLRQREKIKNISINTIIHQGTVLVKTKSFSGLRLMYLMII